MSMQKSGRFWEIDSLRGAAIILMVISNLVTDIAFFGIYSPESGFWTVLARVVVSMFILLSGISLTLSYSRIKGKRPWGIHKKYLLRGARIFSLGMLITIVTWVFIPRDFVLFGILHLIGISIILGYFLVGKKNLCLALGLSFILIGVWLEGMAFDFPWLLWLGFIPAGYASVDYVPLLPWFGMFLVGMFTGSSLYPEGKRGFRVPDFSDTWFARSLAFLGRNSLKIYIIHQPVLILLLWLLFPLPYGLPF
jgi:uncharacterized membrane protein